MYVCATAKTRLVPPANTSGSWVSSRYSIAGMYHSTLYLFSCFSLNPPLNNYFASGRKSACSSQYLSITHVWRIDEPGFFKINSFLKQKRWKFCFALVPNQTSTICQRLMSRWKYRDHWSEAPWTQPVFNWITPFQEVRVLLYNN